MRTNTNALQEALNRGEYSHELLLMCVAEGRRQRAEYISTGVQRLGQRLSAWLQGSKPATGQVSEPRIVARSSGWSGVEPQPVAHEERRAA